MHYLIHIFEMILGYIGSMIVLYIDIAWDIN